MRLAPCTIEHAQQILDIFNEAILNSTALWDYQPRPLESMTAWFATKSANNFPVIGAFDDSDTLLGFASFGTFRAFPAYKYTVEHSIYIHTDHRGKGLGKTLLTAIIEAAQQQDYHTLIGGICSSNTASIKLHQKHGFQKCASIKQAGYKFDRWLDLDFYQLLLPTPITPTSA